MDELIFTLELPQKPSSSLIYGNLALVIGGQTINYLATSGAIGAQYEGNWWQRGKGPIPPGIYSIPTKPYYLPTKGVEGQFFHVMPDPIGEKGQRRSELGIHHDANVPGSSGCIVIIRKPSFEIFCKRLLVLHTQGIKRLPLTVKYN